MAKQKKSTSTGRRYRIKRTPHHWVTRNADGTFRKWTNIKRALAIDKSKKAKKKVKPGFGYKGDTK